MGSMSGKWGPSRYTENDVPSIKGSIAPSRIATSKMSAQVARSAITLAQKSRMAGYTAGNGELSAVDLLARLNIRSRKDLEAETLVGSVIAYYELGDINSKPHRYRLGDIVIVPHVVPSLDPYSRLTERHVGYTENTGPICGKMRPSIVVGICPTRLTCLPLFTSGGRGVHSAEQRNSLWIRKREDASAIWEGVDESDFLMVEANVKAKENTFVNLNMPFTVPFECPMRQSGSLTDASWHRLQEMWMVMVRKGFEIPENQEEFAKKEIDQIMVEPEFAGMHKQYLEETSAGESTEQSDVIKRELPSSAKDSQNEWTVVGQKGPIRRVKMMDSKR